MGSDRSALASWSPDQIALGRRWVGAWKRAASELERLRRDELRHLDAYARHRAPVRAGELLRSSQGAEAHLWTNSTTASLPRRAPVNAVIRAAADLRTCSAEDLVVLKSFADRPKDRVDVEGILIRQADRRDWAYVRKQLAPLVELKESPEILRRLDQLRRQLE